MAKARIEEQKIKISEFSLFVTSNKKFSLPSSFFLLGDIRDIRDIRNIRPCESVAELPSSFK
jgi:hypothetical protein